MKRFIKFVFVVTCLFVTKSHGLVTTIIYHSDDNGNVIEMWADDHLAGSIAENRRQLKQFVETILPAVKAHLVIESKFFYNFDSSSTTLNEWLLSLEKNYGCEGQDPQIPTWIAWDLPIVLVKIFSGQELPHDLVLSYEQICRIRQNITFDFIDPRLQFEGSSSANDVICDVANQALNEFEQAAKTSPKKVPKEVSSFAKTHCERAKFGDVDSIDHLMDVKALNVIIGRPQIEVADGDRVTGRKTVMLCGTWHAYYLDRLIPLLSFSQRSEFSLARPALQTVEDEQPKARRKINFDEVK